MFFFWLVVFLFVALQFAAIAMAVVSRNWTLRPEQVVWRGIDVPVAANYVQHYLYDIDDSRWAYPTGAFVPDKDATNLAQGVVVMREANFPGSTGMSWIFRIFARMRAGVARDAIESDSFLVTMFMAILRFSFALWVSIPLAFAAVLDMGYRALFRSRIEARVRKHPDIEDAVTVDLELQGMSAFGLTSDVLRGMTPAALPAEIAHAAGVPVGEGEQSSSESGTRARAAAWVGQANRRFRVVQTSAIGVAVLAAVAGAAVMPTPSTFSGDDSYYSDSSGYDESGSDAGYDDGSGGSGDDAYVSDDSDSGEDTTDPGQFVGASYSITAPSDWIQDSEEKDKGSYEESRWHLPGNSDVYAIVNRTAGYGGSAAAGARSVRADIERRYDDYVEHDWRAYGSGGWLWEFSADGDRKVDIFTTACGDGYAFLGATPEDEFEEWRDTFMEMAETLEPDCERDGGDADGSDSSDSSDDDTTTEYASVDDPAAFTYRQGTYSYGMERAIRRHFQARLDGEYGTAYDLYGPPLQQKAGNRDTWAEALAEDGLNSVTIDNVRTENVSSDQGTAYVQFTTESSQGGCMSFDVRYTMKKDNGRWKLWRSKADSTEC